MKHLFEILKAAPVSLLLAGLLASCATGSGLHEDEKPADDALLSALHDAESIAAKPEPPPPQVLDSLLKGPKLLPLPGLEETRFDIDVKDEELTSFLMSLVADTPYNMVISPEVSGHVSLTLKSVTVLEVMDLLKRVYGVNYQLTKTGILVLPQQLETRIFEIDYLDFSRRGTSSIKVSSGQVTDVNTGNQGGAGFGNSLTDAESNFADADNGLGRTSESAADIETSTQSDVWKDLEAAVRALVGTEAGREVIVNAQSSIIVVKAMPRELEQVERFLHVAQDQLRRQVVLEAKIVEVELNGAYQTGINWSALNTNNGNTFFAGQSGGQNLFENGAAGTQGADVTVGPNGGIGGFTTQAFGGTFILSAATDNFNAFLELLDRQGNTRVLSSPRISTLNNQKAVIKVGSDEFFVTDVTSNTAANTTSSNAVNSSNIELTPFFSGIALDVTPQISHEGDVTLHVHPLISEVVDKNKSLTVDNRANVLPLAFSSVRQSDSIVRAHSGQIIVIGGLMKDSLKKENFGTPFLSDIPGLGELFTQRRSSSVKTELVILLKATVVENAAVWQHAIGESARRVEAMGGG